MKKSLYWIMAILTICFVMVFLVGCKSSIEVPTDFLVDDDYRLSWTPIDLARSYNVEVTTLSSGSVDIRPVRRAYISLSEFEEGDYEFRVQTVTGANNNKFSEWSEVFAFHKDFESGMIYRLINGNMEYEVLRIGTASGDIVIEDYYRNKPVTGIATNAFKGSNKLASIVIGKNVTYIGDNAFYNCSILERVEMSDSVERIGTSAFQGCSSLESITLPKKLTSLERLTFGYCINMTEVIFNESLLTIGEACFVSCSSLEEVVLPDSVLSIGNECFSLDTRLMTFSIGTGLQVISSRAFSGCVMLDTIIFSDQGNLKQIGTYAFKQCEAISDLILPDGLIYIGGGAFMSSGVTTVSIPDSVQRIGAQVFNGSKLHAKAIDNGQKLIYADKWVTYAEPAWRAEVTAITEATFAEGTVGLADQVFVVCENLATVKLPASIKYINPQAFSKNDKLWRVQIPEGGVEYIGAQAFSYCPVLSNVMLGEGLLEIGDYAFFECPSLDNNSSGSIIPSTVTSIGQLAFYNTKLWSDAKQGSVVYAGDWVVWFKPRPDPFGQPMSVDKVEIKEGTRGIADYAFYGMPISNFTGEGIANVRYIGLGAFAHSGVSTITLGDNIKVIEPGTFWGCKNLYRVSLPASLTTIDQAAFYGCSTLSELNLTNTRVDSIGSEAFFNCTNLKEVNLGRRITEIAPLTFYGCSALVDLVIPDSVESIGQQAFYKCESLETIQFGANVSRIDDYAFMGCTSLLDIVLPDAVETIGNFAFYRCPSVETLVLGENVRTIGNYAFGGLEKVKEVSLPASLESIGNYAFKGWSSLQTVVVGENVKEIGAHAFYGCHKATIYTTAETLPEGWDAFWNSSFRPVISDVTMSDDNKYIVSVTAKEGTFTNCDGINEVIDPYRKGYNFVGWATSPDATSADFTTRDIMDFDSGRTFYAVWEEVVYQPDQPETPEVPDEPPNYEAVDDDQTVGIHS